MKKIWLILTLVLSLNAQEGGTKKVVYDLTTGSIEKFSRTILGGIVFQKSHYESKMEEVDAVVVVHGEAYRFFLKSLENTKFATDSNLSGMHPDLLKRLESLHKNYGVTFKACQAGLKNHRLVPVQLVDYVELIPSSTTGLIDAQNDGYAYIPIH